MSLRKKYRYENLLKRLLDVIANVASVSRQVSFGAKGVYQAQYRHEVGRGEGGGCGERRGRVVYGG